ncbi:cilia- and flagella-associated protein 100-like [Amphibalanus amphitrite]|uniref:cilia- and flagella-associated protein 100-like n=1 Tax=Amphibalanus amphitrite TaxID=1232801 RepID=UPI001C91B74C|nr:cilia- and flagella-associated protein 100-like [Amphibalanus amphitrite]
MTSAEGTRSRTIQRPQMRVDPEDADNPFVLPANSEVFTFRQQDVQNQKEKKDMQLSMPIYKRQYHQPRITARLPPTPEPEDPQVAQDDAFFRKNLAYTRVAMQNKGVERQTLAEFVQNKKDMFFLQYTINVKREQMTKLDTTVKEEQERLDHDKKKIEKDYQVFDEFLKENDHMAVEAIRLAEDEAKTTLDKVAQIRQINIQIMATKSFIIKLEERFRELRMYRRFLFLLAPAEWRAEREANAQRLRLEREALQLDETASLLSQSGSLLAPEHRQRRRRSNLNTTPSRVSQLAVNNRRATLAPVSSRASNQFSRRKASIAASGAGTPTAANSARASVTTLATVTSVPTARRPSMLPQRTSSCALQDDETAADAELYFSDTQQLFAVFQELEEQNLKLIQNSQETEESLEEMKTSGEVTKERISREVTVLEQQVGLLEEAVRWEEEKSEQLELFCKIFNQGEFKAEEQESALAELNERVTEVYTVILGENQANISTLQMLASLESHIEDMFGYLETVPADRLHAAEKLRDRERRLKLRELKIVQQQQAQAERLRRTRQRAMAEVVRHTGRPLVFRSRPPTPQQLQRKTAKETEEELEEFNYFFGE